LLLEEQQFGHTEYPQLHHSVKPTPDFVQRIAAKLIERMYIDFSMNDQRLIEFWNRFFATGPICELVVGWFRSEDSALFRVSKFVWARFRPVLAGNRNDPAVENILQRLIQLGLKEAIEDRIERIQGNLDQYRYSANARFVAEWCIRDFRAISNLLN